MQLTINGEAHRVAHSNTLAALVVELGLDVRKIAMEHNAEIIARARYDQLRLAEGDVIEIIHFMGGG